MTLFNKIYWTLAIISAPLLAGAACVGLFFENIKLAWILASPFYVLAGIMLLDIFVCEIILRKIWKVNFTLFPGLFD